jgi:aminodeoxychorismate lyase
MIIFLNGEFLPEEEAHVSIFDRGFLYGDGLFETMRVFAGQPFRWEQHLARLNRGADFLRIRMPFTAPSQREFAAALIKRNSMPDCIVRITLSRGVGERGYSPQGADSPTFLMTLHSAPSLDLRTQPRLRIVQSSLRLPSANPLAAFKTTNKLPQILARAEADALGAAEALLLNERGEMVEATASNLFWIENGTVCTPGLATGALPGITREMVLELSNRLNVRVREMSAPVEELRCAQGVFLTNSATGIVEAGELDGHLLPSSPLVQKLQSAYANVVELETRSTEIASQ